MWLLFNAITNNNAFKNPLALWFLMNNSWEKKRLSLQPHCWKHNTWPDLAHVWHLFHNDKNKDIPPIKRKWPRNVKCTTVFLTVLKFFMVEFISLTNHLLGCCLLVGLHCVNGSPHMAAASFRANLLNLMDSEKAFGLHVLALPTPCFLSFFLSLFLPLRLTLLFLAYWLSEVPLDTRIHYLLSSACLRCSDCWRFSSTLQTGLILNKGEGLELAVFQHSRGERREVCVPGTRFLQHAVTSLQLSPSLMLPDRWGCV